MKPSTLEIWEPSVWVSRPSQHQIRKSLSCGAHVEIPLQMSDVSLKFVTSLLFVLFTWCRIVESVLISFFVVVIQVRRREAPVVLEDKSAFCRFWSNSPEFAPVVYISLLSVCVLRSRSWIAQETLLYHTTAHGWCVATRPIRRRKVIELFIGFMFDYVMLSNSCAGCTRAPLTLPIRLGKKAMHARRTLKRKLVRWRSKLHWSCSKGHCKNINCSIWPRCQMATPALILPYKKPEYMGTYSSKKKIASTTFIWEWALHCTL